MTRDDWQALGATMFLSLAVLAMLIRGTLWLGEASCDELGQESKRRTTYRAISGCYVEVNGRMIPTDSWRGEETR